MVIEYASASCSTCSPRKVSNPASPGPAPTRMIRRLCCRGYPARLRGIFALAVSLPACIRVGKAYYGIPAPEATAFLVTGQAGFSDGCASSSLSLPYVRDWLANASNLSCSTRASTGAVLLEEIATSSGERLQRREDKRAQRLVVDHVHQSGNAPERPRKRVGLSRDPPSPSPAPRRRR